MLCLKIETGESGRVLMLSLKIERGVSCPSGRMGRLDTHSVSELRVFPETKRKDENAKSLITP